MASLAIRLLLSVSFLTSKRRGLSDLLTSGVVLQVTSRVLIIDHEMFTEAFAPPHLGKRRGLCLLLLDPPFSSDFQARLLISPDLSKTDFAHLCRMYLRGIGQATDPADNAKPYLLNREGACTTISVVSKQQRADVRFCNTLSDAESPSWLHVTHENDGSVSVANQAELDEEKQVGYYSLDKTVLFDFETVSRSFGTGQAGDAVHHREVPYAVCARYWVKNKLEEEF